MADLSDIIQPAPQQAHCFLDAIGVPLVRALVERRWFFLDALDLIDVQGVVAFGILAARSDMVAGPYRPDPEDVGEPGDGDDHAHVRGAVMASRPAFQLVVLRAECFGEGGFHWVFDIKEAARRR